MFILLSTEIFRTQHSLNPTFVKEIWNVAFIYVGARLDLFHRNMSNAYAICSWREAQKSSLILCRVSALRLQI